jgi:hypothetical protein
MRIYCLSIGGTQIATEDRMDNVQRIEALKAEFPTVWNTAKLGDRRTDIEALEFIADVVRQIGTSNQRIAELAQKPVLPTTDEMLTLIRKCGRHARRRQRLSAKRRSRRMQV